MRYVERRSLSRPDGRSYCLENGPMEVPKSFIGFARLAALRLTTSSDMPAVTLEFDAM